MTTVGNEENQNNENVANNDVDPIERETAKASSSGEHDREERKTEKNQLTLFIVFPNGEADVLHEDAPGRREESQG
ncbi:hypothetical protein OsJ_10014 [Oryza sativa Japonica Group]|uniref:Uncharacterized protein n=4 Tax=Oryza TaxID=4527 RepID=A3AFQ9_ORYSJ|nr:Hypothetical protein [Oryza sativa Japonica Group]AAO06954.1 Hypothetical protein [Oryza sativa Japonica Group]ABF94772.1 hypothetical protein LOC_Os03g12780 [Oryza sativa Japonica Group]EAZ26148.1 hypothetical protein OsJ_10014 [Oryza sativa Japonica Group]